MLYGIPQTDILQKRKEREEVRKRRKDDVWRWVRVG
jgi:hypothetical protein